MSIFEASEASEALYVQLKDHISERIQNGDLKPGDKLLTENEFAEQFGISRATVRHALSELEIEGLIERYPGKGTIVSHKRPKPEIMKLTSFTQDMLSSGLLPESKVVDMKLVVPPPNVIEGFNISKENKVWLVSRLRLADKKPVALQDLYIPPDLQISVNDLNTLDSYYEFIEKNYALKPSFATELLSAKAADENDSKLLEINEGDPLIYIWRNTYDENEKIIEIVKIKYVASRYQYHLKLYV